MDAFAFRLIEYKASSSEILLAGLVKGTSVGQLDVYGAYGWLALRNSIGFASVLVVRNANNETRTISTP